MRDKLREHIDGREVLILDRAKRKAERHHRRVRSAKIGAAAMMAAGLSFPLNAELQHRNFEAHPSDVIQYHYETTPGQEEANRNSWCFSVSGAGNDINYFDGIAPALAPYCNMAQIKYSNAGIDFAGMAKVEHEFLQTKVNPFLPITIYRYGGSMGGMTHVGIEAELEALSPSVRLGGLLFDGSPAGSEDVRGSVQQLAVEHSGDIFEHFAVGPRKGMFVAPTEADIPYKLRVARLVALISSCMNGDCVLNNEAIRASDDVDLRLRLAQFALIDKFTSTVDLAYLKTPGHEVPVFYLHAANPLDDTVVDVTKASAAWKRLLPQTVDVPVIGGKHANPNEPQSAPGYNAALTYIFRDQLQAPTYVDNARMSAERTAVVRDYIVSLINTLSQLMR